MKTVSQRFKTLLGGGFILLFSLLATSHAGAQTCVQPPSGLVSWWPGDGNANDIQGGNHGTLQGDTTFGAGKVGQAFNFDGFGDFVSVPDSTDWDFGSNDFSIDLWVKFDQIKDSMFIHQQSGNAAGGWEFDFQIQLGGILVFARDPFNAAIIRPWSPQLNTWYHLAVTRTGDLYRLYVDGTQLGPAQFDANPVANVTGILRIGSWAHVGTFDVDGLIDELEIYNRALTDAEIQAIFNAGSAGKCVLTLAQQRTALLIDQVNGLVATGVLSQGRGSGLIAKLQAAINQINLGNVRAASNELEAFISQVNAFVNAGILSPSEAQPLLTTAQAIINMLGR